MMSKCFPTDQFNNNITRVKKELIRSQQFELVEMRAIYWENGFTIPSISKLDVNSYSSCTCIYSS